MHKCYVIDTNTFISAVLLPQSVARQAVDKAVLHGAVLVSAATIAEVMRVITRPKFDRYVPYESRRLVLALLLRRTTLIPVTVQITDCRDPKDNKFLEVAVAGNADVIISGDDDLLVLHPYRGISICTPGDFVRDENM